jgi:hypothetical protein
LRHAGVNRAAAFSLLARGAQSVAALVSVVLVARSLTVDAQGYFYTLASFIAFVQLADFGLAYAVMQSASHEVVRSSNRVLGMSAAPLSLLTVGAIAFGVAATIAALSVVGAIGTLVLWSGPGTGAHLHWVGPWVFALAAAGACQLLVPWIAVLEGSGHVAHVWKLRLEQELLAAGVLCIGLFAGFGLWVVGLTWAARFAVGVVFVVARREAIPRLGSVSRREIVEYWRRDVWPFQWRLGLSALSGFFVFQVFSPIIFRVNGAQAAARFGMTLAVLNGLLNVSAAWMNSQAPAYGHLIVEQRFARLRERFFRDLGTSLLLIVVLAGGVVAAVWGLIALGHPLAARLLPLAPLVVFAITFVVNHVIAGLAVYLRAFRREPLLVPSVVGAVLTPIVVYAAARYGTALSVAVAYLALTLVGAVIAIAIFRSALASRVVPEQADASAPGVLPVP